MNPRSTRWIALVQLVLVALQTDAQEQGSKFRRFGLREGLSQSTVNSIAQDRYGFLWFGTQDGLNRYDGYAFKVYTARPGDSTNIVDDYIWKTIVAQSGEIWIGTYNGGLNKFDPMTERFTVYKHNPADSTSLGMNNVVAVYEDRSSTIWVGTWGAGLSRLDGQRGTFTHYRHHAEDPTSLIDNRIGAILEDSHGDLWIATWGGLSRMQGGDRGRAMFKNYKNDPNDQSSLSNDLVWALVEDHEGTIWIGTWAGGLNRYDRAQDRFTRYQHNPRVRKSLSSNIVTCLTVDSRGALWIGTSNGGVNRFDLQSSTFHHVRHDPLDPESLGSNGVMSITEDRGGGLWFGHEGAGISNYDRKREKFLHLKHRRDVPGSLGHNIVRAIFENREGGLWVGTRGGGLNYRKPATQEFVHYRANRAVQGSLSSDFILSVIQTRTGDVFAGSQDLGLSRLPAGDSKFTRYFREERNPNSLSNNSVAVVYEDRAGDVWVGTSGGGLDLFNPGTAKFKHYQVRPGDSASISGNWVRALYEDSEGKFWVGTWGMGLNLFDRSRGTFRHFLHSPSDSLSLSNNTVMCIAEDEETTLWIGTEGGGLNRFDRRTETFIRYTEQEGLPNNVVYGILSDGRGSLWMSTNRGLSRFDPRTRTFRNYDVSDGLQSNEFNQGAFCRTRDGMLLFGGIEGLTLFHPDSIVDNQTFPPVALTSFRIFEEPVVFERSIWARGDVTLQYWQNFFSFEFAALDFTAPEKNKYAYMLEGFDRDWVQAGTRRYASYTQVGGGTYTFRVKGSNSDGVWNETGTALQMTIVPPYWQTWWFRALGVLVVAGILFLLYQYRVRRLVEIERMRVRIASDLHDDIGSNLTRIAVQSEIIQTTDEPSIIRSASSSIGAASREIITTMSDIVWSIDARNDTVGDLLDRMRDFAAELLGSRSITLKFEQSGLEARKKIPVDVRQNIYLIFKEAINNIARHSTAQHVTVSLVNLDGRMTMTITDDGVAVERQGAHGGQGLRNMAMRAERIRAKLTTSRDHGMIVTLTMKSP